VPVLEELHGALVLLGLFAGGERAQVAALAGPGVHLPRIETVLSRLQLANHHFLAGKENRERVVSQFTPKRMSFLGWPPDSTQFGLPDDKKSVPKEEILDQAAYHLSCGQAALMGRCLQRRCLARRQEKAHFRHIRIEGEGRLLVGRTVERARC
jgi:hypothetical protein